MKKQKLKAMDSINGQNGASPYPLCSATWLKTWYACRVRRTQRVRIIRSVKDNRCWVVVIG